MGWGLGFWGGEGRGLGRAGFAYTVNWNTYLDINLRIRKSTLSISTLPWIAFDASPPKHYLE